MTTTSRRRVTIGFFFAWYDFWIGAYWSRDDATLYVCPLPTLGVRVCFDDRPRARVVLDANRYRIEGITVGNWPDLYRWIP